MEAFRTEVRAWLAEHLTEEFKDARGGPGREHEAVEARLVWERLLGEHGWTCLGWPAEFGGRGASIAEQVIFHEEYARAEAPARMGHIGEGLIGPTIIALGTPEQQQRFLSPIRLGQELWCQGYSEPDAGSDLANVQTKAVLDGDEWVLTGQKVWTSLATIADWAFVLCRTDPAAPKHKGLSYLLVPMKQAGIEVRPIVQLTGTSEFNEVFFDGARTAAANIVGAPGDGWRVAMATLAFERGVATLGQQVGFQREFDEIVARASCDDPLARQRLASTLTGLRLLRWNALRGVDDPSLAKLHWATWHRDLGELSVDVDGMGGQIGDQPLFLFTRADTIYGGSNQIQRNVIGERTLGLPR